MPVMPAGACMVAESACQAGHDVKFLDFMFQRKPVGSLIKTLKLFKPGVIALSIRNIDNNDMRNPVLFAEELLPVMKAIKSNSRAAVVLGGAAVSIMPEDFLRYTGASFAMSGDGASFPDFLDSFSNDAGLGNVPGLSRLRDGEFHMNETQGNGPNGSGLALDYRRWIDVQAYRIRLAALPVRTKTGCDFKCVYCTYDKVDGGHSYFYEPEQVAQIVKRQVESGFKDIEFVDNVFNYPYGHAMSVCEEIIKAKVKVRLQSMDMNPAYMDDALLSAMERSGFKGMGITVESASDGVLKGFEKGFTAAQVIKASEIIRRHSIPCLWFFMLGGPGETQETVEETLRFIKESVRPGDVAYITLGIRIYPGTKLEAIAREQGILPENLTDMLQPLFYVSPEVDTAWLTGRVESAGKEQSNIIIAGEANIPATPVIYRLGYSLGLRPPLWRFLPLFRRGMNLSGFVKR